MFTAFRTPPLGMARISGNNMNVNNGRLSVACAVDVFTVALLRGVSFFIDLSVHFVAFEN